MSPSRIREGLSIRSPIKSITSSQIAPSAPGPTLPHPATIHNPLETNHKSSPPARSDHTALSPSRDFSPSPTLSLCHATRTPPPPITQRSMHPHPTFIWPGHPLSLVLSRNIPHPRPDENRTKTLSDVDPYGTVWLGLMSAPDSNPYPALWKARSAELDKRNYFREYDPKSYKEVIHKGYLGRHNPADALIIARSAVDQGYARYQHKFLDEIRDHYGVSLIERVPSSSAA